MPDIEQGLLSRRNFVTTISTAGIASLGLKSAVASIKARSGVGDREFTILFQGDSITDGNRGRSSDPNHIMGHGYAFSIASRLGADYPERNLKFINKGISGNTVNDLLARWQPDTLDLKPDVLSILVGVNDAYFRLKDNITTPDNYRHNYRKLLDETRAKYPAVVFALCEPFTLPVGMVKENPERWKAEMAPRQKIVRELATQYNAVFVGFQDVFTKACDKAAPDYWIWDGIHPTVAGHELMAREWISAVGKRVSIITAGFKK